MKAARKPQVVLIQGYIQKHEALGVHPWYQLIGTQVGHPRLGSGSVYTSPVVDIRNGGRTIETRNTIYKCTNPVENFRIFKKEAAVAA